MSSQKPIDIAIVGGGIAGLTLAIALHHRGIKVNVYESAEHFGEIGAGVAFTPNAVQAMRKCAPGVYDAFESVRTTNIYPSKSKVWFDMYDGYGDGKGNISASPAFTVPARYGQNGVHRAHFLDELVHLVPEETAHFGKRLDKFSKSEDSGKMVLHFRDGSTAEADAIIGCDGIKSKARQLMFGSDHPCAHPVYTYKYAYRGMVQMSDAVAAVGEEKAHNACLYMGPDGHVLTFPVDHGGHVNIVAFHSDKNDWPDYDHLTRPASREDALRDFESFGADVKHLLQLTKPNLDVWAIFDTCDHPPPSYCAGRVCLHGDAAHATSPHHGAGAGFCIEGSAIMAELLADEHVKSRDDLDAVFSAYNALRRPRCTWLTQSSRFIGKCYDWHGEGVGNDFAKIEAEMVGRNSLIADVDIENLCESARLVLHTKLG